MDHGSHYCNPNILSVSESSSAIKLLNILLSYSGNIKPEYRNCMKRLLWNITMTVHIRESNKQKGLLDKKIIYIIFLSMDAFCTFYTLLMPRHMTNIINITAVHAKKKVKSDCADYKCPNYRMRKLAF